jgi:hypothetical protein
MLCPASDRRFVPISEAGLIYSMPKWQGSLSVILTLICTAL